MLTFANYITFLEHSLPISNKITTCDKTLFYATWGPEDSMPWDLDWELSFKEEKLDFSSLVTKAKEYQGAPPGQKPPAQPGLRS